MTEKVTATETEQTQPSKKMKIAKVVTNVAINVGVTIVVGVVSQVLVDQVNKKFFPDQTE